MVRVFLCELIKPTQLSHPGATRYPHPTYGLAFPGEPPCQAAAEYSALRLPLWPVGTQHPVLLGRFSPESYYLCRHCDFRLAIVLPDKQSRFTIKLTDGRQPQRQKPTANHQQLSYVWSR